MSKRKEYDKEFQQLLSQYKDKLLDSTFIEQIQSILILPTATLTTPKGKIKLLLKPVPDIEEHPFTYNVLFVILDPRVGFGNIEMIAPSVVGYIMKSGSDYKVSLDFSLYNQDPINLHNIPVDIWVHEYVKDNFEIYIPPPINGVFKEERNNINEK